MTQEYIITTLMGIVLVTYGFIFKYVIGRILKLEEKPECNGAACLIRFANIERKQSDLDPIISRVESALSRLEAVIEFLQKDYDNRQK